MVQIVDPNSSLEKIITTLKAEKDPQQTDLLAKMQEMQKLMDAERSPALMKVHTQARAELLATQSVVLK